VAAAQQELRSLMTLEKIRAIRAGELNRRTPAKQNPKRSDGLDGESLKERIYDYLSTLPGRVATSAEIADAIGSTVQAAAVCCGRSDWFEKNEDGFWEIATRHDRATNALGGTNDRQRSSPIECRR